MSKTKNAFYYFMQDFREDQKRKGIRYANMAEVAVICGPLWKDATPEEKREYQEKANMDKKRKKDPELIYTSIGVSLAELQRQEKQQRDAEIADRTDVKNLVLQMNCNGEITDEDFFLIDVNYFCKHISNDYIIGESTVLQLSLRDGLKNKYHEIIHPGEIPIGYQSDVKHGAKEIGLDMPDERVPGSDYRQLLNKLIKFLKQNDCKLATIPPLFTMPDKLLAVRSFVQQMCFKAGVDVNKFRVYRLDTLLYRLANAIKSEFDEGFPKEHVALAQLKRELSMFSPGTACEVHEEADRALVCSEARVKCWAYTVLDSCCPLAGVKMWPSSHVPPDPDLGTVEIPAYPPGLREQLLREPQISDVASVVHVVQQPTSETRTTQSSVLGQATSRPMMWPSKSVALAEMQLKRKTLKEKEARPGSSVSSALSGDSNKASMSNPYVAVNTWSINRYSNSAALDFSSDSGGEADSECTSVSPARAERPPPQLTDRTSPEFLAALGRGRGRHLANILAKVDLRK